MLGWSGSIAGQAPDQAVKYFKEVIRFDSNSCFEKYFFEYLSLFQFTKKP